MSDFPGFAPGSAPDTDMPLMRACIDLLGRAGASAYQIGWVDEVSPPIWYASVVIRGVREVAAAMDPSEASYRLCEQLIDGGTCVHCQRPSAVTRLEKPDPMEKQTGVLVCWYRYSDELRSFKRGCEL